MEFNFNNTANQIFTRLLTNNNLSEAQASELQHLVSQDVLPQSVSYKYKNSYDFGFLKETRQKGLYMIRIVLVL